MQEVLTSERPSLDVHALWPPFSAASPAPWPLQQPPSPLQSSPSLCPCAQPWSVSAPGQSCYGSNRILYVCLKKPIYRDVQRQRITPKTRCLNFGL